MEEKLCHISGGRYSFLVRSPDMVQQGSLVFVLGDMPGRKVDIAFSSLYPEFNNKCQADLSMEVTKPVKLGFMSPVVVVKLVLGLHGVRQSRHHIVHGTELERGPRDSCSKENSLIMV